MGQKEYASKVRQLRLNSKMIVFVALVLIFALAVIARCGSGDADGEGETPAGSGEVAENGIDPAGDDSVKKEPVVFDPQDPYKTFEGALFIGDSRTEGLKIYAGIENAQFFCAKSMTIDKVVDGATVNVDGTNCSVYDILSANQYTKVYICLGINELGWVSIEKFLEEYKTLIGKIKETQPKAHIYIELLFPVTTARSDSDKVNNNSQIYWYNTNLIKLAEETGVKYLNPDKPLIDEKGGLKEEATSDGIHVKREYCIKWAEYLAEITY